MIVLHANWSAGRLRLWGESAARRAGGPSLAATPGAGGGTVMHPFAASVDELREVLREWGQTTNSAVDGADRGTGTEVGEGIEGAAIVGEVRADAGEVGTLDLLIPIEVAGGVASEESTEAPGDGSRANGAMPSASPRLAHYLGLASPGVALAVKGSAASFSRFRVECVAVPADRASALLEWLESRDGSALDGGLDEVVNEPADAGPGAKRAERPVLGASVRFFAAGAHLAQHLMAQQRVVPGLRQELSGALRGVWQPWLADAQTAQRVAALVSAMPASVRAAVDAFGHEAWAIVEDYLCAIVDAECRRVFAREQLFDAIDGKDPSADLHVAWLSGLLGERDGVEAKPVQRPDLVKHVRRWLGGLEDRGASAQWRLCLVLREPDLGPLAAAGGVVGGPVGGAALEEEALWPLTFHLQSVENPKLMVSAEDVWILPSDSLTLQGKRVDQPQELLLKELARAARLYPSLDRALDDSEPESLQLDTRQAYGFLREFRPLLIEQGFGVQVPPWWDWPSARLGARLKLDSQPIEALAPELGPGVVTTNAPKLGMNAIVGYGWQITVGGTTLSLQEFQKLADRKTPLVRINGQWVEIRPEDLQAAMRFIKENPGGQVRVGEALQWAFGNDSQGIGIPIVGLETSGWLSAVFGDGSQREEIPTLGTPTEFHGTLRPYQERGLSWLVFLEKLGFGPCLADDMGLGKTVQLLALLTHEHNQREAAQAKGEPVIHQPTLLVVPMSVVGNWMHEATRFSPQLKLVLHHGPERKQGEDFVAQVSDASAVVTTYALAARDQATFGRVRWRRVVLDEAQYIKNPGTKQTQAVMAFPTDGRVALTGTPVENRLSELWSIMEFLNPGYLGTGHGFRKRFAVPIERFRDAGRSKQLRELVRPFVLRRLKSDPSIAADLPEKLETREYSHLTSEQAELYEQLVRRMLEEVERAEGIQRRGLVLATLIKLKQVCNHPSQFLKDALMGGSGGVNSAVIPEVARSGKCVRLVEMLDEVVASGECALVFTQFREMAEMLAAMLRHELDRDVLLFHGGTTQGQRVEIVQRFQRADGTAPVMVISLKAGGVGLNLTAASHIFHFDRWWNPAVENQATDRAHRIGQTKTVHVHKFVVRGTLEERIDEMIEQKTELAQSIIGAGEDWLTELSTDQLREMLTLRREAVGEE